MPTMGMPVWKEVAVGLLLTPIVVAFVGLAAVGGALLIGSGSAVGPATVPAQWEWRLCGAAILLGQMGLAFYSARWRYGPPRKLAALFLLIGALIGASMLP